MAAPTSDKHSVYLGSVRPKLLHDSIFLPTQDGVYFRSRGKDFTLKGEGLYDLVSRLAPRLVGQLTVNEICAQLSRTSSQAVQRLIAWLLEKKIVIDHFEEDLGLGSSVLRRFSSQIEFIEHFEERPLEKFAMFRRSRAFLTGNGVPLRMLVLSLMRNGIETILLDDKASGLEKDEEIVRSKDELLSAGVPISVQLFPLEEALSPGPYNCDAICYAASSTDLKTISKINGFCCGMQMHFIPGFLLGDKGFVGPRRVPSLTGCWMCFLLRYSSNMPPGFRSLIWRHLALGTVFSEYPRHNPSLRIIGNTVAFELFRLMSGQLRRNQGNGIFSINLETLEMIENSHLLPHPNCPHCCTYRSRINGMTQTDSASSGLGTDKKFARISRLVNEECGVFKRFDDDDLDQSSLFRSVLAMYCEKYQGDINVPGYAIESNAHARIDAAKAAAKLYALSVVDDRRMIKIARRDAVQNGQTILSESTLSGWTGAPPLGQSDEPTLWMRASSLDCGEVPQLVPAAAVYPTSGFNTGSFERTDAGVGVGFTVREASRAAACSLLAYEVLRSALTGDRGPTEIDPISVVSESSDLGYLMRLFQHLNQAARMVALKPGPASIVVLASSGDDPRDPTRVTVGTGASLREAAVEALVDLLGIMTGGKSMRTVENYLPTSLGYVFDWSSLEQSGERHPATQTDSNDTASVPAGFRSDTRNIVIVNITPEDIATSGLILFKALLVSPSPIARLHENVSS